MVEQIQIGKLYKKLSDNGSVVRLPDYFIPLKMEIGMDAYGNFMYVYEGSFPGETDERTIWRVMEESLKTRYCLAGEEYR